MPFTTAAVVAGTTAASTATIGGAAFVGSVTTWGATAATIAADAALITGGVSAFSQLEAGAAAKSLGKSQKALSVYNAMLDKQEAEESLSAKGYEEQRFRAAGEKLKSQQRVAYAKAGSGTPMDVLEDTAVQLEMDALTIRREGQIGYRNKMSSARLREFEGRNALTKGRYARRASYYKAGASAIGGLGNSIYYREKMN